MRQFLKRFAMRLAKQKKMSPYLGALITIYSSTAIVYAPLTLIGVATTIYGLWGGDMIRHWLPWFTIGHLLGVMVLFLLMLMVVFNKVVIPSLYAFQTQQQYKHSNPMVTDIQKILSQIEEVNKGQAEINERLNKLEERKCRWIT